MTMRELIPLNSDLDGTLVEKPTDRWRKITKRNLEPRNGVYCFLNEAVEGGALTTGRIFTARPRLLPPPFSRESATAKTYERLFAGNFDGFELCGKPFIADETIKAGLVLGDAVGGVAAFLDDRSKLPKRLIDIATGKRSRSELSPFVGGSALAYELFGDDSETPLQQPLSPTTVVLGVAPGPTQEKVLDEVGDYARFASANTGTPLLHVSRGEVSLPGLSILLYGIPEYSKYSGIEFSDLVSSAEPPRAY